MDSLLMRLDSLDSLMPLKLDPGVIIHTHEPGKEAQWEQLIQSAFSMDLGFWDILVPFHTYEPEYVLYVSFRGRDVATAMGTENPRFPGEGWIRLVAAAPDAAGHGFGRLAVLAALHSLAARGYRSVLLQTEDFRLPAIATYRSLGFRPVAVNEDHRLRWQAVEENLSIYRKHKAGA